MAGTSPSKNTRNKAVAAKGATGGKAKSAFEQGKTMVITHGRQKDRRNLLKLEALDGGIVVAYLEKPTKKEEAFAAQFFIDLEGSAEERESIGCSAILLRKGVDGETPMPQNDKTTWGWRVLVFVVGVEGCTPDKREELARKVIEYYNKTCNEENYKFPTKLRFGSDNTASPPRPVDTALLDEDVIGLMNAAYGHAMTYEDMMDDDTIMKTFWEDTSRGQAVMQGFLDSFTEGTAIAQNAPGGNVN